MYSHEIETYVEEAQVEDYSVHVFLSREGYFKKITPASLRMAADQKYKDGDGLSQTFGTTNGAEIMFFTDRCQVYKTRLSEFEDTKASALGDYLPAKLSMDSGEKPLVTTLLENETYRSMYEGYLKEIAEKYFTQEYMTELVTKIHDLIAPYVQNDPTAFCTYEEFEQACSTDPTDQYSLAYYAVNMAESIENQLNGGEPTFNTSSMQGGGFGGEKQSDFNGEKPDMPSRTEQTTDAQQNAQQNDRPTPPDQNGGQQGGQMDENERSGQQSGQADGQQSGQRTGQQGSPPDFGGGEKNPPGMPGQDNKSVRLSDCLPTIAVCGGVFVVGVVVLILFKRKKDLKPPKENKTE